MKSKALKRVEAVADLNQIIRNRKVDLARRDGRNSTYYNLLARERSARYNPTEEDLIGSLFTNEQILNKIKEIVNSKSDEETK